MTDTTTTRQTARSAACPPTSVWICAFDHRDDLDIWACATEALAYHELAIMCREFWEDAREVDEVLQEPGEDRRLGAKPPDDDRVVVESYFAVMNDSDPCEWFLIDRFEVVGAEERGSR